jgi:DNA adenine methylase
MAPRIVALLPPHNAYVEVFGGSGAVLFAKDRAMSKIEVLNDCDSEIVNFFRVLQDHDRTDALMERLLMTPYSRQVYEEMCDEPIPEDPVLRAWNLWARARMAFGGYRPCENGKPFSGSTRGRWRRSLSSRHQKGGDAATLHNKIDELERFTERLLGVYIENKDFPYILDRWDSPRTVFYLDPPYFGTEGYYDSGLFPEWRHYELADHLARIKGKAIVSYYPHPKVDELYPADRWQRSSFRVRKNQQKTVVGCEAKYETELLLMNFEPARAPEEKGT